MKERPILFSAPMVRALLDGSKTQTRRPCKYPIYANGFHFDGHDFLCHNDYLPPSATLMDVKRGGIEYTTSDHEGWESECPYGQPGDRLWVREAHWWFKDEPDHATGYFPPKLTADDVEYRADGDDGRKVWRPSIHMPRWASRLLLEVTGARLEPLQDISEADANAEGCERLNDDEPGYVYREEPDWKVCPKCGGTRLHNALGQNLGMIFDVDCHECDTYVKRYRHLWESINGPDSWTANPWVWVIEFKVVQQ